MPSPIPPASSAIKIPTLFSKEPPSFSGEFCSTKFALSYIATSQKVTNVDATLWQRHLLPSVIYIFNSMSTPAGKLRFIKESMILELGLEMSIRRL